MPQFLDGPHLTKRLRDAFEADATAKMAVAFWGKGAADRIGLRGDGVRVVCNLTGGGTNPQAIRELMNRDVWVRHLPSLHAKLGVVGDVSFLGSSNVSTNGLGNEGAEGDWAEFNILYKQVRKEIEARFEELWNHEECRDVDDVALEAQRSWILRTRANAEVTLGSTIGSGRTILQVLKDDPHALDQVPVYVVTYVPEDSKELDAANEKVRDRHGSDWECYQSWSSLPPDCYLLDFEDGETLGWVGILRRISGIWEPRGFQAAQRVGHVSGLSLGRGGPARLKAALGRAVASGGLEPDEDGAR